MAKAAPGVDLRDRRRARPLEHAVRDHRSSSRSRSRARPKPVQAWSVGRAEGLAAAAGDAAAAAADRAQCRARRHPQDRWRRALGRGHAGRDRRRARRRQDPPARGDARRGRRLPRSCTPPARPTRRRRRTSCGATCCARCWRFRATRPTTRSRRGCAKRSPRKVPDLEPWLPLLAIAFGVDSRPPRPKSRCSRRRTAARSCTRWSAEFLER